MAENDGASYNVAELQKHCDDTIKWKKKLLVYAQQNLKCDRMIL